MKEPGLYDALDFKAEVLALYRGEKTNGVVTMPKGWRVGGDGVLHETFRDGKPGDGPE